MNTEQLDSLVHDTLVRDVALRIDTLAHKASVPDSLLRETLVRDTLSLRPAPSHTQSQETLQQDTLCLQTASEMEERYVPSVDSCLRASAYNGPLRWQEVTSAHVTGEVGERFVESYYRADFYILLLLAGLALLVGVWKRSFRFLRLLTLQFFFPLRQTSTSSQAEVSPPRPHLFLIPVFVLSLTLLAFRWYDDRYYYLYSSPAQPYQLFLVMSLCVSLYLIVYQLLIVMVHAVFFAPAQRQMWRDASKLFFCVQTTLVFLTILGGFLLKRTPEEQFWVVLGVVVCSKLFLLFKAKSIFFCGLYGYFHILLYLCALETAPLLILSKFLMNLLERSDMVIY